MILKILAINMLEVMNIYSLIWALYNVSIYQQNQTFHEIGWICIMFMSYILGENFKREWQLISFLCLFLCQSKFYFSISAVRQQFVWHYYPHQQQILANQWTWGSSAGDGVCTVMLQNTVVLEEACMLRGPVEWYSTFLASARLPGFDTAQHEMIMVTMTVITQTSVSAKLIQNTVWSKTKKHLSVTFKCSKVSGGAMIFERWTLKASWRWRCSLLRYA